MSRRELLATGGSSALHVLVLLGIAGIVFEKRPPVASEAGIELEIIDTENAMPLPDPELADSEVALQQLSQPVPLVQASVPDSAMPAQQASVSSLQQPLVPQSFVAPKVPEEPTLGPGPVVAEVKAVPMPPAPARIDAAPPPSVAPTSQNAAPPPRRPVFDPASLSHAIATKTSQTQKTRLSSAAIGSAIGKATPKGAAGLSVRQKTNLAELVRSQITPCWNPPTDDKIAERLVVVTRIRLDRTGALIGIPDVATVRGRTPGNAAFANALAGSVRRAVMRCSPLRLPAELFEAWSDIELTFDPRDIT